MQLDAPILMPAIRLDKDGPAEEALALKRAAEPWLAGFILFGGEAEQVRALTARLREAAGRDLLMASDMERGAGQQIQGLTQIPPPGLVGFAGSPREAMQLGGLTAREAGSVGIDVIFAPCLDVRSELDNPIMGNRSYGFDPELVATLGTSFGHGVAYMGGLPVAKHFPGHGATSTDSHESIPVVHDAARVLEGRDLVPFATFLRAMIPPAFMTAHVTYPALEPAGGIASFSPSIVARGKALGLGGIQELEPLVFTDALIMTGAICDGDEVEGARRSLRAGCDVLLYPGEPERIAAEILTDDALRAQAERAAALIRATRAEQLSTDMRGISLPGFEEFPGWSEDHLARAAEAIARRAVERVGSLGRAHPLLVIDDDDMEQRGDVLLSRGGARAMRVRVPRGETLPEAFRNAREPRAGLPTIIVLASCRGWKGASGVSEAGLALLAQARKAAGQSMCRVIWCAPRMVPGYPFSVGDIHLPGTGHHLEAALADCLFGPGP